MTTYQRLSDSLLFDGLQVLESNSAALQGWGVELHRNAGAIVAYSWPAGSLPFPVGSPPLFMLKAQVDGLITAVAPALLASAYQVYIPPVAAKPLTLTLLNFSWPVYSLATQKWDWRQIQATLTITFTTLPGSPWAKVSIG